MRSPGKWSWRAAEVAGIGIYIHVTLVLFMAWVAIGGAIATRNPAAALGGVVLMALIFVCVALHELGHALTARRYGIRTLDIILLPIGGVARLERMPERPAQELVVALAGPAVNVVIAVVLAMLIAGLRGALPDLTRLTLQGGLLSSLLAVNVLMVLFNLIPAFPMDGGRVLRALLALKFPYARATEIAANAGQAIAVVFGVIGLFGNPMLLFIALFVFLAASEEWALVQARTSLAGLPVSAAMITHFRTLAPDEPLARAVDHLMEGYQQDFPVVEGGRVLGILHRHELVVGLSQSGPQSTVGSLVQPSEDSTTPNEALEVAVRRMQEKGRTTMPVLSQERLVGLLSTENVGELLMVRSALAKRARPA
jgi:Zn-dependent protease